VLPSKYIFYPTLTLVYVAGDMPRGGEIDDLAYLLDRGVRVALIYGKFSTSFRLP